MDLEEAEPVEEPVGHGEDEDKEDDDRAEDVYARRRRTQPPEEQCPASECQDDQLEREADELALAVRPAWVRFPPDRPDLRNDNHDDRGDVRNDPEGSGDHRPEVPGTPEPDAPLQLAVQMVEALHRTGRLAPRATPPPLPFS